MRINKQTRGSVRQSLNLGSDYKTRGKFSFVMAYPKGRHVNVTAYFFVTPIAGKISVYAIEDVYHPLGMEISQEQYRTLAEKTSGGLFKITHEYLFPTL